MKLVFSTGSLPHYGLIRNFEFAKAAGFDGIEVVMSNNFDTQNADYLKRVSEQTAMSICSVRLGLEISFKHIGQAIKLAEDLEVGSLILTPPLFLDFKSKQWIKFELEKVRSKKTFKILFENPEEGNYLSIVPKRAYNSFQDLASLGDFALDTSNVYMKKASLLRVWHSLKNKIPYITLSNYRSGVDHTRPMDGQLPLESFLERVAKYKFDGIISILVKPTDLSEGKDEKVAKHLAEIKDFVMRLTS